jgi:hypothetical protein
MTYGFVNTHGYRGPERRKEVHISDEQIERIAEKAAQKAAKEAAKDAAELALQEMFNYGYKAVGKNVIEKGMWVVGVLACGLFAWLASKGFIRVG